MRPSLLRNRKGESDATLLLMTEEPDARSEIDECVAKLNGGAEGSGGPTNGLTRNCMSDRGFGP
jgi:hypothetical protein